MKRVFCLLLCLIFTASSAYAQNPRTATDFYNRGLQKQAQQDLEGALADFEQALARKPHGEVLSALYLSRSNLLMAKGDLNAALLDLNRALALDPRNFQVLYNRGVLRLEMGQLDEAIVDLNATLAIQTNFSMA